LIEPRLTSDFQISALKRLVEADGGFATILRKGDITSGAIVLVGLIKGAKPVIFERFPSPEGGTSWQETTLQTPQNEAEVSAYWQKRCDRDPDLWVVELDVASPERLAGLLTAAY
jgi:hypothetical protein